MSSLGRRYGVSPAGFYAWQRRGESTHAQQDRILSAKITALFTAHTQCYGSPRIHRLLADAGWRYLTVVMDYYSRRVLAWALTRRRTARVSCTVLTRAARRRGTPGVIFHSDRGSEYMGAPFCEHIARLGFLQSASVRGPGDNAHIESFFHSLKAELTRAVTFSREHLLRSALQRYIRYYNGTRLHSALGYRSPIAFERQAA